MILVFIYYNNPLMLARQIEMWNQYPAGIGIVLVDDGSQSPPVLTACNRAVTMFRIDKDIPWNCAGARNLGCSQVPGWIAVSDIDTLWPVVAIQRLLARPLSKAAFYLPSRVTNQGRPMRPSVSSLIFHRESFDAVGGYDEDYAGHHGREDADFYLRLKRLAAVVRLEDVVKCWIPPYAIKDSATPGPRDDTRNKALLRAKRAAGFPRPTNPLRFPWHQIPDPRWP